MAQQVGAGDSELQWLQPSHRARAAQQRIDDLDHQLRGEYQNRDRAVREAIDHGAPMRQLASFVGIARASLYRILGSAA